MNFLFSRPGALSIAMNGALVLVVLLIVLFGRLKKRLKSKHWKPVTATVLRIQAVDPRIGKDTVGPRKYRLDLVFDWQGLDWHRSWYFPRTYDLPQAGDTLSLLYNQKEEQFQLQPDPEAGAGRPGGAAPGTVSCRGAVDPPGTFDLPLFPVESWPPAPSESAHRR